MALLYSDITYSNVKYPETMLADERAVVQNVLAIFETTPNSKWFRPRIGTDVQSEIFEPHDQITADSIKRKLETALPANGEFRMRFQVVEVIPDYENQQYYVNLMYDIPTLGLTSRQIEFNLDRVV